MWHPSCFNHFNANLSLAMNQSTPLSEMLGPEALEAIRSCPAVQFIQAYKALPQTNIPGSIEVEPEVEPLTDVNGCDV